VANGPKRVMAFGWPTQPGDMEGPLHPETVRRLTILASRIGRTSIVPGIFQNNEIPWGTQSILWSSDGKGRCWQADERFVSVARNSAKALKVKKHSQSGTRTGNRHDLEGVVDERSACTDQAGSMVA